VILYGFCFAGTKLGVYAMMLWMPMYLKEVTGATNSRIANIQTLYEVGAVLGTVVLGYISDKYHARRSPIAITAMTINTLIALSFFFYYDSYNFYLWLAAMFCFGFFLGSIHHIICCCCTADLGRLHTKQATSTITGIIDGIGSGGSGLGQMLLGYLI
jgi:sugar phosphate permease